MPARAYRPPKTDLNGLYLGPDAPRALTLFLHGYGANGADLLGLGQMLAPQLTSMGFVAPDAPQRLPFGPNAFSWFDLDPELRMEQLDQGVQQVRSLVMGYIESLLQDFDVPAQRLLLCGFSQGCMVALEVAPRLAEPLGHVVGLSGALVGVPRLQREVLSRPPIFLGHGRADPVVPFASLDRSALALREAGFTVETAGYEGIGHGISPEAIATLTQLARALV